MEYRGIEMKSPIVKAALFFISAPSLIFSVELLTDPDFDNGFADWGVSLNSGVDTSLVDISGDQAVNFNITDGGSETWDITLFQGPVTLQKGFTYTLDWEASRESDQIDITVSTPDLGYIEFINDTIAGTNDYIANQKVYHHCSDDISSVSLYANIGGSDGDLTIKRISLIESDVATDCPVEELKYVKVCDAVPNSAAIKTVTDKGPVSYFGQLQACGKKIIGEKTQDYAQVKGMSLFWSQWSSQFYNSDVVDTLAISWKSDVIRAAMAAENSGGYISNPEVQEALVDVVVQAAIDNDIFVIIDFHSHYAHYYEEEAITFFTSMAKKWGSYDNVIFEIYNEPLSIDWSIIKDYAEPVIAAIRQHSDNLVVVGTPVWSQNVTDVIDAQINDENVAYTLHFYAGSHFGSLRTKAKTALAAGIPLFVTEWGAVNANGDGGINESQTRYWLELLDEEKISWANWALNNKDEGSSALSTIADVYGLDWVPTGDLTESGTLIYNHLQAHAETASSWRTAGGTTNSLKLNTLSSSISDLRVSPSEISYKISITEAHIVNIVNVQGETLYSLNVNEKQNDFSHKVNLNPGIYFLEINSKNSSASATIQITK
jgi:hypothetical protein